jgi:hypothetical protein
MNNISEGFAVAEIQSSNNFLKSKGFNRGKNMYYIAEDQDMSKETAIDRRTKAQNLINGIAALIKYLNLPLTILNA